MALFAETPRSEISEVLLQNIKIKANTESIGGDNNVIDDQTVRKGQTKFWSNDEFNYLKSKEVSANDAINILNTSLQKTLEYIKFTYPNESISSAEDLIKYLDIVGTVGRIVEKEKRKKKKIELAPLDTKQPKINRNISSEPKYFRVMPGDTFTSLLGQSFYSLSNAPYSLNGKKLGTPRKKGVKLQIGDKLVLSPDGKTINIIRYPKIKQEEQSKYFSSVLPNFNNKENMGLDHQSVTIDDLKMTSGKLYDFAKNNIFKGETISLPEFSSRLDKYIGAPKGLLMAMMGHESQGARFAKDTKESKGFMQLQGAISNPQPVPKNHLELSRIKVDPANVLQSMMRAAELFYSYSVEWYLRSEGKTGNIEFPDIYDTGQPDLKVKTFMQKEENIRVVLNGYNGGPRYIKNKDLRISSLNNPSYYDKKVFAMHEIMQEHNMIDS